MKIETDSVKQCLNKINNELRSLNQDIHALEIQLRKKKDRKKHLEIQKLGLNKYQFLLRNIS